MGGRCPALCLSVHLHKTAPWNPCTTGLLMLLQRHSSYKNYFSANTTGSLPWEDFLCLLISSLRCQSSLCISLNIILALDLSHFGALISAGFALDSHSFYINRENPEEYLFPTSTPRRKISSNSKPLRIFCTKTSSDCWACLSLPPKPSTWTAVEPILQLINTSTSSPKICLIRHSLPIQAATAP